MYIHKYFKSIISLLDTILETQEQNINQSACKIVDTIMQGKIVWFFGCTHAGILSQEAFYRTGGLAIINPIFPPGLTCDVKPVTLTSQMERIDDYGGLIVTENKIGEGDLVFVHSVSGRNPVPVDFAIESKKSGAFVIAITNIEYSKAVSPRGKCKKLLYEVADLVIDNCGEVGDASITIDGFNQKVAPTSTVTGAVIVNAITAQATAVFMERNIVPPVFVSANIDGGDAHNAKIFKQYAQQIKYL